MASDKPADVQYLIDAVGLPLQKGLAEVLFKMPQDPVEYLATWLYAYCGVSQAVRQEQQEELLKIAKANAKENEKFESELLVLEKDQVHADEASIAANASQKHSQEEHHAANAEGVAEAEPSKHVEEAAADGQQTSDNIVDLGTDRTGELHDGATHRTEPEAENIEPNADQDAIEQPVVADGEAEASASHEAQPDETNQAADEEKPNEAETARTEHVEPTHDAEPAETDALHTARSEHPTEEHHAHETTHSEIAETLHGDPPAEEAVHTEHEAEQHHDAAPNQEQSHNPDAQPTDEAPLETERSEQPADEQQEHHADEQAQETARSDQAAEETHSEHAADEPQATERSEPPADNEKPQSDSEEAPAAEDTQETARSNEPQDE